MALQIGQLLHGYCRGFFGRKTSIYGPKRVEGVGFDWVVVRDENGELYFAQSADILEFLEESEDCKKPCKF